MGAEAVAAGEDVAAEGVAIEAGGLRRPRAQGIPGIGKRSAEDSGLNRQANFPRPFAPCGLVHSEKSLYEAATDLRAALLRGGFVVVGTRELGAAGSGFTAECDEDCTLLTVDHPGYVRQLLELDMRLVLALPWRLAVFTQGGATRIGFLRPGAVIEGLPPGALALAAEVEEKLARIVDVAR